MKNLIKGLVILAVASSALATVSTNTKITSSSGNANTTYFNFSDAWKKLQKSPLQLAYLNEGVIRTYGGKGLYTNHYVYAGYKIDKYHSFKIVPAFKSDYTGDNNNPSKSQRGQGDIHTEYQYTTFRLYRSSILTQKEHGIGLSGQIRYYVYGDNFRNSSSSQLTKERIYPYFSKTWGKFHLSVPFFTEFVHGSTKRERNDYVGSTLTYSLNDSWSFATGLEYYTTNNEDSANDKEYYTITPVEVTWSKGRFSATASATFDVAESKDRFDGFINKWHKNGSFVTSLYYSFF
jgi:hypothetical protein